MPETTTATFWVDVWRAVAHCQTCLDLRRVFVETTHPVTGYLAYDDRPCPDCAGENG